MMKIYFFKTDTDNNVIITDGKTAKIYNGAPNGIYEGVDLYAGNAAELLRARFEELAANGDMNGYSEIWTDYEVDFDDVANELKDAVLVFAE